MKSTMRRRSTWWTKVAPRTPSSIASFAVAFNTMPPTWLGFECCYNHHRDITRKRSSSLFISTPSAHLGSRAALLNSVLSHVLFTRLDSSHYFNETLFKISTIDQDFQTFNIHFYPRPHNVNLPVWKGHKVGTTAPRSSLPQY